MLTLTLRNLERDGLVTRTVYPEIPPRVEYQLTPLGRTLTEPLDTLWNWAAEHMRSVNEARANYDRVHEAAAEPKPERERSRAMKGLTVLDTRPRAVIGSRGSPPTPTPSTMRRPSRKAWRSASA